MFTTSDVKPASSMLTFHLFPSLPVELRCKVWQFSLERQRIIKLCLRNRILMDWLLAQQGTARPDGQEDEQYGAVVDGYQTLSKLFRLNQESRGAALRFYRLKLPCWLIKGAAREDFMRPGILYFNPDYDFLYISNDTGQVIEFLHDLKTVHDPRGIGLLNLAIDHNGLRGGGGLCNIHPSTLSLSLRTSFTTTLVQLRQVFLVQEQRTGRCVFGYGSGALTSEYLRNHSFPIAPVALNFDRLRPDPRPIRQDLRKVFVNVDPRVMIHAWRRLMCTYLSDETVPHAECHVLLALGPMHGGIYDSQDAEEWLQKEEDMWIQEIAAHGQSRFLPSRDPQVSVATAFGFWLFAVDTFGPLPSDPNEAFRIEGPRIMDLTDNWPDLALVDLP
jgi:hypothetical protein